MNIKHDQQHLAGRRQLLHIRHHRKTRRARRNRLEHTQHDLLDATARRPTRRPADSRPAATRSRPPRSRSPTCRSSGAYAATGGGAWATHHIGQHRKAQSAQHNQPAQDAAAITLSTRNTRRDTAIRKTTKSPHCRTPTPRETGRKTPPSHRPACRASAATTAPRPRFRRPPSTPARAAGRLRNSIVSLSPSESRIACRSNNDTCRRSARSTRHRHHHEADAADLNQQPSTPPARRTSDRCPA